jgi:glucan phosphoethanolaminetransferase (alkaline phosphatase superfamily)
MAFASAYTLLVSFFVQLVGVASGTGTTASPGVVIQLTAYVVYVILVVTYFWNNVASVLLYALLCCIYAALFGTSLYFCPRLLQLLQPSLVRHSGLAIRLATCSILCILVFGGRTFGFARKVIVSSSSSSNISCWYQYGALELVPSVIFLVMMHPQANRTSNAAGASSTPPIPKSNRRSESPGSFTSKQQRSGGEAAPLLVKPVSAYGGAASAGEVS